MFIFTILQVNFLQCCKTQTTGLERLSLHDVHEPTTLTGRVKKIDQRRVQRLNDWSVENMIGYSKEDMQLLQERRKRICRYLTLSWQKLVLKRKRLRQREVMVRKNIRGKPYKKSYYKEKQNKSNACKTFASNLIDELLSLAEHNERKNS